jgi:hypothetical protein
MGVGAAGLVARAPAAALAAGSAFPRPECAHLPRLLLGVSRSTGRPATSPFRPFRLNERQPACPQCAMRSLLFGWWRGNHHAAKAKKKTSHPRLHRAHAAAGAAWTQRPLDGARPPAHWITWVLRPPPGLGLIRWPRGQPAMVLSGFQGLRGVQQGALGAFRQQGSAHSISIAGLQHSHASNPSGMAVSGQTYKLGHAATRKARRH